MELIRTIADKLELKIALRTAIGASLTWIIDQYLTESIGWTDRTISGLWAVISAIVILQSSLGGGYLEGSKRFLGVLIGSLFGVIATTWFGSNPFFLGVSLFFTVVLMGAFGVKQSMRIGSLSCAVVIIVWNLNPVGSPWVFALHRFLDSTLGIIVGILTSHLIFPSETEKSLKKNRWEIFHLFSSLLKEEEGENETITRARTLLKDDEPKVRELQAELTRDSDTKEAWEKLHFGEKRILDLLVSSIHVSKKELYLLLDEPLFQTTEKALSSLDHSFKELADGKPPLKDLAILAKNLKNEMGRFRETRATRSFSLPLLESYFVFFYNLEQLLLETHQMAPIS